MFGQLDPATWAHNRVMRLEKEDATWRVEVDHEDRNETNLKTGSAYLP